MGLEKMFRIYCLQQWYGLSDPGAEEALYDMISMRLFAGIELADDRIPDETTILNFRRLLEKHDLTQVMFDEIRGLLEERGLYLKQGTLVDATMIAAPRSTKNQEKKRDQQMSSTRKGNDWHFGMKAHIGVDAESGLIHSVVSTTAKVHDSQVIDELLHGQETIIYGDKAYSSDERSLVSRTDDSRIWAMPFKKPKGLEQPEWQLSVNRQLSRYRARVEHSFRILKCQFGYRKTRYRGLEKNAKQQLALFALANLYKVRHQLLQA